jgi:hypothetical protein
MALNVFGGKSAGVPAGKMGYDGWVKNRKQASRGGFVGMLVLLAGVTAAAQINGAPPSVTSLGFGGRAINGAPPSVTSIGPRGPVFNPAYPSSKPFFGAGQHHHYHSYAPLGAAVYAVPIYGYGYADAPDDGDDAASAPVNGPAMPGVGAPYRSAGSSGPEMASAADPADPPDPAPTAQPKTELVFKDGRQMEIGNYAIVGSTLYELAGETRHKIALSDLDLDATVKANEDRGIDFTVPPGSM